MDKTQISPLSLYAPEDLILRRNRTLIYDQGVEEGWGLTDWTIADYDLLVCLEGGAVYRNRSGVYPLSPGRAYLAIPDFPVSTELGVEKRFHVLAQHFTLSLPDGENALSYLTAPCVGALSSPVLVREYCRLALLESASPFLLNDLFRAILWDLLGGIPGPEKPVRPADPLKRAVRELAAWIRETDPDRDELNRRMDEAGYAPVYLRDAFRQHFGATPRQYATERRMDRARNLLIRGHSVKETALLLGYSDELYFARVFRKWCGIAPGRFGRHVIM